MSVEAAFVKDVLSSPPDDPSQPHQQPQQSQQSQQQQQQQPQQPQQSQQQQQPKKRTPRYQWDVERTKLFMSALSKYVTDHGFPKTSHLTGSHGSHPYDSIATTINNHGIPANNRVCDGRVVETRWDTMKKLCYEKCSEVCARFMKHLPDIAHESGQDVDELKECTSTMNVEGQLAAIIINKTSPHFKLLSEAWDARLAKETIQSIPLNEVIPWVTNIMEQGYKVKHKRKSPTSSASTARKNQRVEDRQLLVDELGGVVSDSDASSSSRSASQSPSPRASPHKQSPTAVLNEKLTAYLELQIKQQQQQQQQQQQRQPPQQQQEYQQVIVEGPTKKLDESYVSLEAFYEKEQVKPEARSKLLDMGVNVLDDLHYVTCDDYVRAGLSLIAGRKLCAKVSRHKPD